MGAVEARAKSLAAIDKDRAVEFMHNFNVLNYNEALGAASKVLMKANKQDIVIMKDKLSLSDEKTVRMNSIVIVPNPSRLSLETLTVTA